MEKNTFFNYETAGNQTFQVRRDHEKQLIYIRPFAREGNQIMGVSDEYVFDPGFLRAHPDHGTFWVDHMCWAIENRRHPLIPDYARAVYPFVPTGAPDQDMRPSVPRHISIFVPFADSQVSEMLVMCYLGAGLPLIETEGQLADRRIIERDLMPSLAIDLPEVCAADKTVRGKIRLHGGRSVRHTIAYLECSAGYLPKREIDVHDGVGEFSFTAMGLFPGDKARVSCGFKYYMPKSSTLISVQ